MKHLTFRDWAKKIVLWSWLITLPIVVIGGYTLHQTWKRFDTFDVRYTTHRMSIQLRPYLEYQIASVKRKIGSVFTSEAETELPIIQLSIERRAFATLEKHMPQSGFEYVKGTLMYEDGPRTVKVRYRGDTDYHWAFLKKSFRVKTKKDDLFQGMRAFNLMAPKFPEQMNNYLGYKLAEQMGLLGPTSSLVRVFVNGQDRGVHVLVEQLEELTLRRNAKMPGDIYRGELFAKDRYRGIDELEPNLFKHVGYWDKISINNHYPDASMKPMEALIRLVQSPDRAQAQAELSELLDMEAWGVYSAYESLVLTFHVDDVHNWRLYYDPWTQKLVPVVWDPVGWHGVLRRAAAKEPAFMPVIHTDFRKMLFKNGDFLRAREAALSEYFDSGKADRFLAMKDRDSATVKSEIETDLYLRPQDPEFVRMNIDRFSAYIDAVFADGMRQNEKTADHITYADTPEGIRLSVGGAHSVKGVMLKFAGDISWTRELSVAYQTRNRDGKTRAHRVDMGSAVQMSGSELTLNAVMVPNSSFVTNPYMDRKAAQKLEYSPGVYDIAFDVEQMPASVWVDLGAGWKRIDRVAQLAPRTFDDIFEPIESPRSTETLVWRGIKKISGVHTIERPLIIEPGTVVDLAAGASIIFKNQVTAQGTKERPIRFRRAASSNEPWGAIGLLGEGANGSIFSHCSFTGGSGYKGDLFEYSGMFSAHDVKDLVVEDCEFADGTVVDDMVHLVYATAEFNRTIFRNSFSDAFDIDISEAKISESSFEKSGNDAVDLMSSVATIDRTQFVDSGDKGVSVGEGSFLLGVNNTLKNNEIGVQSKDGSNAILYNQSFVGNRQALHAYKKNWRYGAGGEILLFKSRLAENDKNITAERKSNIVVFDSYADTPVDATKRVSAFAVDDDSDSDAKHAGSQLPDGMRLNQRNNSIMQRFDPAVLQMRDLDRRGAM